jgi:murein DD-endopeptidase MepM/ murein hydrolase activator NlpD
VSSGARFDFRANAVYNFFAAKFCRCLTEVHSFMKKSTLYALAGVLALSTPFACVPAEAGVLNRLRSSISDLWGQNAAQRHEARAARNRASQMNDSAEALHDKLEKAQQVFIRANAVFLNYRYQVKQTESKIISTRHRIQITQARYDRHKKMFGARLASMQRNGQIGYLNMLLGSRTLSDLSRRAYLYQAIAERDSDLQRQIKADREELQQAQYELQSQWKQRNRLQQAAMQERTRVVRAQSEQMRYWKEIKSNVYAQLAYANAKEQTAEQLEGDIQQLEAQRAQIVAAYEAEQAQRRAQYAPRRTYRRRYRRQRVARRVTRTQYVRSGGVLKPMEVKDVVYEDVMVPVEDKSDALSENYHVEGDGHDHSDSEWVLPGRGRLSSRYGMRYHPILRRRKLHTGDDIAAGYGSSIKAARGGTVLYSGWKKGYGNTVIVDHGGGVTTLYGHASKVGVRAGQPVRAGEYIGNVGSTGYSTGPHLHFEVRKNGKPVDPTPYLRKARKN